jgi:hypothetical protein
MKNKLLLIVLLAFVALQACVKDEEKVFDASAAERTNEAVNNLRDILVAEPNGWLVEYYPETDRSMGGYYFIWKFDANGTVVVAGEQATANYPAGDTVRSCYNVIANRGVVLTFDTYNDVFHYFSEPRGTNDVDGYAGDYEFVLRECTPEKIVMTGKKRGNRMEMTPYTGGDESTWKNYLEQFEALDKKFDAPVYLIKVDGELANIKKVTRKNRTFQLDYGKTEDNEIVPYITTTTGIKLYEPLTVNGKTAQYFTFDEKEEEFIAVEPGVDMAIKRSTLPPNVFLAETTELWIFDDLRSSNSVQTLINSAKSALVAEGLTYDLIYCGHSLQDANQVFGFFITQNSTGNYYHLVYNILFVPIAGTDDKINLTFSSYGLNGNIVAALKTGFIDSIIAKSPYSVVVDNPKNTAEITVTSVADPSFYFVVTL